MDLLQDYSSNSSSSPKDECLTGREFQSVYLVIYSQSDVAKFQTREVFVHAIVESFSTGTAEIVQWVCCWEKHRKGRDHYHLGIKLDRNQRWMMSKRYLQSTFGITVHYSSNHHNYYSAWLYVTKSDSEFKESSGHPDLRNRCEPRTDPASRGQRQSARREDDTEQTQPNFNPVFWVHYSEAREMLARYEIFNERNNAQKMSFDDLFLKRKFSGQIYQVSNQYGNRPISEYKKGVEALKEARRLEDDIFNLEQDLWEY